MTKNILLIACAFAFVLLAASPAQAGEQGYQDIPVLQRKAGELLQAGKYKEAIETYGKVLELIPKLPDEYSSQGKRIEINCHYNTACAYSLLEEKEKAVEALKKAVKAGWGDIEHMKQDTDLDNIREMDEYKKIISELSGEKPEDEPTSEDEPEEKPEDKPTPEDKPEEKPETEDEPEKKPETEEESEEETDDESEPVKKKPTLSAAEVQSLRRKAGQHHQNKEYEKAIELYKKIIEAYPDDSNALYNTACGYSLLDKKAEAVEYLIKAVGAGFVDFAHIETDTDLDNIREEEGYKKLLAEKGKYLAESADKIIERYKKRLGDEYTVQKNKKYKLIIITNVDSSRLTSLRGALIAYADCHWKDFFKNRPEYYITVLIPKSTEDYRKHFGGRSGAAGFYNPGTKILTVNLATGGGTMIHEFTHALHWGDMEGLSQRHPQWVVEGFGSLYEQCTRREGSGYGLLNWRLPGLKRAIANETCYPLKDFISNSGSHFRKNQSLAYAISRYIFYFLQEKKLLRKWYAKYRENYDEDKSGLKTLEEIYGKSIEEFEKDWLEFLEPLNYGRGGPSANTPFIGVNLEETDDGLKITQVQENTPADKAGLKDGDIILKMDDKDIKTVSDLRGVVSKHKIGDEVKFIIKRGDEEKEITVKLGKR
ncbi:MAG: PDZ domain-containing protein [Planctomycetota bacterium]|nr:MAG: PDZ domain-containing protein [Planctomycetota bacterium]